MRCLMIDVAQTSMAAGAACAIAQVTGVNDNMSQSHYHDYFELYFLDSGERYHLMDDKLFKLQAGDCILFPPQTMHRSYGDQDMAFSRVVLYFRPENDHLGGSSSISFSTRRWFTVLTVRSFTSCGASSMPWKRSSIRIWTATTNVCSLF